MLLPLCRLDGAQSCDNTCSGVFFMETVHEQTVEKVLREFDKRNDRHGQDYVGQSF